MLLDLLTGQQQSKLVITILIETTRTNFNLATELTTNYEWDGSSQVDTVVVISSGVNVYSTTTTAAYIHNVDTGGRHVLINDGKIIGRRGPANGGAGGDALEVSAPLTVDNTNGEINGGGGGGGQGKSMNSGTASGSENECNGFCSATGGAGGAGYGANDVAAAGGSAGSSDQCCTAGSGGSGGNKGQNGGAGGNPTDTCPCDQFRTPPGSGGPAGNAVSGDAFITWTATGIRNGPISSD